MEKIIVLEVRMKVVDVLEIYAQQVVLAALISATWAPMDQYARAHLVNRSNFCVFLDF